MQVRFIRWCIDPNGRKAVSVNPLQVDATELLYDAAVSYLNEVVPAATRIVMKNKQEYLVQGTLPEVVEALNAAEVLTAKLK